MRPYLIHLRQNLLVLLRNQLYPWIYDRSNLGNLGNKARDILVGKGPKREEENTKYPLDDTSLTYLQPLL